MDVAPEVYASQLAQLLKSKDRAALLHEIEGVEAADLALAARHLPHEETVELLKLLPEEFSADVIVHLEEDDREEVLERLTPREIADAVEEMASDDAADIVAELEEEKAGEVVELLEEEDRKELVHLLAYPEDSAGGIMALEVVSVREDRTAARAIEKIREAFHEMSEDFYYVYVVDGSARLVGMVPLARLILAAPDQTIRSIMDEETHAVPATMDQEDVAQIMEKYDLPSVPVVNEEGLLLGRITVDDIVDVIREEAEEDYSRLAGTGEEEFREESITRKVALRLPWLVTGLFGGVLSAVVLSRFEKNLQRVIALAFFVPVITAMGGNVAIQSSAVMIRKLATEDISAREAIRRLFREVGASIVTGVTCSVLIFLTAWLWVHDRRLGYVVGGSMLTVILMATTLGACVPFALFRARIDPALATGPFVTTSNDILGILVYLTLARWMLS
jgi:magnesium transporter